MKGDWGLVWGGLRLEPERIYLIVPRSPRCGHNSCRSRCNSRTSTIGWTRARPRYVRVADLQESARSNFLGRSSPSEPTAGREGPTPGCTPRCSSVHPGVWSTPGVLRVYLRSAARAAQALRRRVVLACCAMLGQPWMFPDPGAAYGAAPRRVRGLSSRRAVRPTSKNRQCALRAPRGRVSAQLFGPRRVDAVRA